MSEQATTPEPTPEPTLDELLERSACRITEVGVGFGRTISLGNYEFVRPEAFLRVEVAEDEDFRQVIRALQAEIHAQVEAEERYEKRFREVRDWVKYHSSRSVADLQAKREEIITDPTWLPKDRDYFLRRLDRAIPEAQEREVEQARKDAEDLTTFALIIEMAQAFQPPAEESPSPARGGRSPWSRHLEASGLTRKVHSHVQYWPGFSREEWAAATPEELLAGKRPEVKTPAAPDDDFGPEEIPL